MISKKTPIFYLIIFIFPFVFFGSAYAAYDCTIQYSNTTTAGASDLGLAPLQIGGTAASDLDKCCYYADWKGQDCSAQFDATGKHKYTNRASGIGCFTADEIINKAIDAKKVNLKMLQCDSNTSYFSPTNCRAGYCGDSGSCQPGIDCSTVTCACSTSTNRSPLCDGHCGSCKNDYVYCKNDETGALTESSPGKNDADVCIAIKYGPKKADNSYPSSTEDKESCQAKGLTLLNPCLGICGCPEGKTLSGRDSVVGCIPYSQRFVQIFEDGLTLLGGKPMPISRKADGSAQLTLSNAYSYGSLNDKPANLADLKDPSKEGFYGRAFVEVDQADNLNWSSPTVPAVIQGMLAGAGYQFCGPGGTCPASTVGGTSVQLICAAGLCVNPTIGTKNTNGSGVLGSICSSSSQCNLGLLCDTKTLTCVNPASPQNELKACPNGDSDCALEANGATSCVLGYCHNQAKGAGAACTSTSDKECAAGFICSASKICVLATDTTARFVGLSETAVQGQQSTTGTGYTTADSACNSAFQGSHVCFSSEIINSILASVPALNGVTASAWINAAAPGNTTPYVSDCAGWSTKAAGNWATLWNFTSKKAAIQACFVALKFACCQ